MRLIDADALIESLKSHTVEDTGFDAWYKAGLTDSIRIAVDLTEKAPTVATVKRGEWLQKHHIISLDDMTLTGTYPTCNICDYAEVGVAKKSNYCPNCGAKMGGESNE